MPRGIGSQQTRLVQAGTPFGGEASTSGTQVPQVPKTGAATKGMSWSKSLPVPYTDTGGLVEQTQADERTLVKELGKLTP